MTRKYLAITIAALLLNTAGCDDKAGKIKTPEKQAVSEKQSAKKLEKAPTGPAVEKKETGGKNLKQIERVNKAVSQIQTEEKKLLSSPPEKKTDDISPAGADEKPEKVDLPTIAPAEEPEKAGKTKDGKAEIDEGVVARLGNKTVTVKDIQQFLASVPPGNRKRYSSLEKRRFLIER